MDKIKMDKILAYLDEKVKEKSKESKYKGSVNSKGEKIEKEK